jgi:hypothetical protein
MSGDKYDKYDEAIDYLTDHPDRIRAAWDCGDHRRDQSDPWPGSVLFNFVGRDGCFSCLTQVRAWGGEDEEGCALADTPLLKAIREDHRIPHDPKDIKVSHLEFFAEWQRKIDALDADAAGGES